MDFLPLPPSFPYLFNSYCSAYPDTTLNKFKASNLLKSFIFLVFYLWDNQKGDLKINLPSHPSHHLSIYTLHIQHTHTKQSKAKQTKQDEENNTPNDQQKKFPLLEPSQQYTKHNTTTERNVSLSPPPPPHHHAHAHLRSQPRHPHCPRRRRLLPRPKTPGVLETKGLAGLAPPPGPAGVGALESSSTFQTPLL